MAWAKRFLGRGGRVVVMTGDGELQEGQNFEALQAAVHQRVGNLWVIVDRNELQSDKPTEEILALGDLEAKLGAFGWHVATCDGHDHVALRRVFAEFRSDTERPKVLIANTIKGKGVSFMEHPARSPKAAGRTAGTPARPATTTSGALTRSSSVAWTAGFAASDSRRSSSRRVPPLEDERRLARGRAGIGRRGAGARVRGDATSTSPRRTARTLLELAEAHPELVVLDGDLASDCRVRAFELAHPARFIENGIAEQDMVSMAGGLARQGLLPVVNSFASFLASRANEQIYNNASERTKVIYACHYAGLIPAGPGKSHQSMRDVSLFGALPNMTVVHPANAEETRALVRWAVEDAQENVAIRLAIGPSPRRIELAGRLAADVGRGTVLREGTDALLFAYGPVMLHEALNAAEALGTRVQVVDLPWLNRVDAAWLAETVAPFDDVFVVEDHAPVGALGDALRRELDGRAVTVFGVEGWPACGTPPEALRFHGLDGASLADRIALALRARTAP